MIIDTDFQGTSKTQIMLQKQTIVSKIRLILITNCYNKFTFEIDFLSKRNHSIISAGYFAILRT